MIDVEKEIGCCWKEYYRMRGSLTDLKQVADLAVLFEGLVRRVVTERNAVAAERDAALFALRAMERNLTNATNNYCECGGRGPGDGCQACETYHWVMGTANPTKGE